MTTGTNFSSAMSAGPDGEEDFGSFEEEEEEWEGGDEGEEYVASYQHNGGPGGRVPRGKGKKDEPMSPMAVVCTCTFSITQLQPPLAPGH